MVTSSFFAFVLRKKTYLFFTSFLLDKSQFLWYNICTKKKGGMIMNQDIFDAFMDELENREISTEDFMNDLFLNLESDGIDSTELEVPWMRRLAKDWGFESIEIVRKS